MEIGLLTDSLAQHPLPRVLDTAAELGITTIELAMGNWSSAPHADVDALVASQARRRELIASIEGRGLCLEALNASGNQLHPKWGDEHDRVVRQTLLLAEQLEIDTVVLMSGLPGARGDSFPAWVTTVWPPENLELLDYQWNEVALPYWAKLAEDAKAHGITKLSVEMHGNQLVYSPPGLLRLREAIGDIIGANFDPSHLMWMGADPLAAIEALSSAIYHVHAKDTRIEDAVGWRSRLETLPNSETDRRAWNFVAVGSGHPGGVDFWMQFVQALRQAGYDGPLSIENEDYTLGAGESVAIAAKTLADAIAGA
ncbi:MAG: sugar phosphate isomerase/epimerase [Tessaracoccus sp.]